MWCYISLQMGKWFEYLPRMLRFGFKSFYCLEELEPPLSVHSQRECLNCQATRYLGVRCFQTPASFVLEEQYSLGNEVSGVCSPGAGWQEA